MKFIGPSFVLDIPTDWFALSSPQYQTMFLSPPTDDGQRANLTITIKPQDEAITAEQFAGVLQQAYQQLNTAVDIHRQEAIQIGNVPGHLTVATLVNGETGSTVFQQQVVAVHDTLIYALIAARPADLDEGLAAQLDDLLAGMLESFRFEEARLKR